MAPPYDILTFGDTAIDLLLTGRDVTPQFGQVEKLIDDYAVDLGGSCCLFAAQAAKLGMKVAILGRVGDDLFGHLVLDKLAQAGIDTQFIRIDKALKTGFTAHLTPTGVEDRAMLTVVGSTGALMTHDVDDEKLKLARHLHYGSLFLHTGLLPEWINILQRAKALNVSTSLDTNYDPSGRWALDWSSALTHVDVLMPNEQEARFIGRQPTQDASIADLRQRVPLLALKLGAAGARLYHAGEVYQVVPLPAQPGGDAAGAGDAFDAGFLAGWLSSLPLQTCLEIACMSGRAVAGQMGGYAGQLWRCDVPALASSSTTTLDGE